MKPKGAYQLAVLFALIATLCCLVPPGLADTNVVLEIFPAFELKYDTQPGSIYQLQVTTNLTTWTNVSLPRIADGTSESHFVSTRDLPQQTFRVRVVSGFSGDGLVAYYPLNGDAADSSTNANDGVLMTPVATTNRFGKAGSALKFNGVSDWVAVPGSTSLDFSNAFSFSVWVKFESGGHLNPRVFHGGTDFSGYQLYSIGTSSSRQFNFAVYLTGIGWTGPVSSFYPAGQWHHFAGTFDGTQVKLFVNGIPDGTSAANGSMAIEDTMLALGRLASPATGQWLGEIDELLLYNRVLSEEEVAVLFLLQQ